MKKFMVFVLVLIGVVPFVNGQETSVNKYYHGILFMAGGRYDNLRRCAATSAGTKGGPIADIMFVSKKKLSDKYSLAFNLPVMRPILFASAFKMLQFEPEFMLEYTKSINEKYNLVMGPGLGASFHYGPDYKSKLRDMSSSFFAVGPFFSWQTGIAFKKEGKVKSSAELKAFYVPLFAKDRTTGTVLGGALLYTIYFN